MVHACFKFPSRALGRTTEFQVLLPKPQSLFAEDTGAAALRRKKCLWFFHGVGDDAAAVLLHTNMADLCDAHDLIVILPSVENSFCLDVNGSTRFRSYLLDELFPWTTELFSVSPERENHLIGGISMGGYGACSIGLDRPDYFSRIICLSGALNLRSAARYSRACGIVLPDPLSAKADLSARPDWDLNVLLERAAASGAVLPEIRLVCSEMDSVYPSNVRFAEEAARLGIPAELRTAPGLHDWSFWRENLPPAVAWAVRAAEA